MVGAEIEAFKQFVERLIRSNFFPNRTTYKEALSEFFSKDFKKLALMDIYQSNVYDIEEVFTGMAMQFGQSFSNPTKLNFFQHLQQYAMNFVDFNTNEANNEH